MKYRVLPAIFAAALLLGGCSAGQNSSDDEAESIVIDEVLIIEETEDYSESDTEEEFIVEDESEEPVPEYASEKESEEETEDSALSAKISRKNPSQEQDEAAAQLKDAAADLASSMETEPSASLMVTMDRVNARSGPSTDDEAYGVLVPGTRVAVLDPDAEWSEVRYMTDAGEVSSAYLKTEFLTDASDLYEATADTGIYAEPSEDAAGLGSLNAGDEIVVSEDGGEFSTVRYTVDGKVEDAYVLSADLALKDLSDDEEAEALLEAAGADEETETETEALSEEESEEETEIVAEAAFEEESESEFVPLKSFGIAEGAEGQFAILQALYPSARTVGVIYSVENEAAESDLETYVSLAESAGMSLNAVSIDSAADIDLAASGLVGESDAVFCLDDETVNGLVRTIDAYADEVAIPVIGISRAQVEDGALAAYENGVLYWNTEEASGLNLSADSLDAQEVEEI